MYEYLIESTSTNETRTIYGYDYMDACRRWHIVDPASWTIVFTDYLD